MAGYRQFCSIAQAAQILTERWTRLALREPAQDLAAINWIAEDR